MNSDSQLELIKSKETKIKKPRKLNNHQKVIARFVTTPSGSGKGFWANEMRVAGQLIQKYSIDFLLWLPVPNGYHINSLVWFLTPAGQHYLSDQMVAHQTHEGKLFEKKEEVPLSKDKIGEDIVIDKKPKTLKDFLNLYAKTS